MQRSRSRSRASTRRSSRASVARRPERRRGRSPGATRATRPRSTIRRSSSRPRRAFLEARPRSVGRGATRGWPRPATGTTLVDGAIDRLIELGDPRRRGVRAGLGGVARSGAAARGAGDPRGASAEGHRPRHDRSRSSRTDAARKVREPDRDAAERLLERNRRSLARVADPRQRRAAGVCAAGSERLRSRRLPRGRSAVRGARRPGGCARKPLMPGTARDRRAHLRNAPRRPRWQPRPIGDRDHGHVQRFVPPSRYSPRDSSRPGTCPDISALRGRGEADRW